MKTIKKLLIFTLLFLLAVVVYLYFESTQFSIKRLNVREEVLVHDTFPRDEDSFSVGYFSDLHYNVFMTSEHLKTLVVKLNQQGLDVVLFGGDLLSDIQDYPLSSEKQSELIQALGQIKAPLGKFAVLGEGDLESEYTKTLASSILSKANFEILDNQDIILVNHQQEQVLRLFGINQQGNPETLKQQSEEFDDSLYTVVLAHKASQMSLLESDKIQLVLAGHTHGGQINIPLLRDRFIGLEVFDKPAQTSKDTLIHISNGVSQKYENLRLFANPEISVYTFKQK